MAIKSYKGFNKDMTCKGFQYEEGKKYETERAECCETGFHACEYPLDCFSHYAPNDSVYHEVEQDGDIDRKDDGTKIASTKIKIGARISIAGIVKAAIEYTMSRTKKEASKDDDYGASSATGYKGASSAEHKDAVAVAWGYRGRAKGVLGSHLVLADWEGNDSRYWQPEYWELKGAKMVQVDGKDIKPDTWYTMENGEIMEWDEEE